MHLAITLNPKHESDRITAFYESLANSGHSITLVYRHEDLKNPDEPVSLENLSVPSYLLRLVNAVSYADQKGKMKTLYERGK